jgi:hypothetical protein
MSSPQNPPVDPNSELQQLFAELVEGTITDERFQTLGKMLAGNPTAQQQYREYVELHAMLQFEHQPQGALLPEADLSISAIPAPDSETASSAFTNDSNASMWGAWQKPGMFGTIGGLVFGFALIAAWSYLFGLPWQKERQGLVEPVAVSEQNLRTPETIADGADKSGINSVQLDSGTATLKLPGIGQVIVEGPAQFDMLSAKRARLNSGRIKMRVTEKEGRGFVVETPYGEVTDLGTEFGLDLSERGKAGLVVFEGAVDLSVAGSQWAGARDAPRVERLVGGEGLEFGGSGRISRIMSIVTGSVPTFRSQPDGDSRELDRSIIVRVTDNRQVKETKKFYEVVPHGLREHALAYVDRPHEWNGVTEAGLPAYLNDADYVRTFNQDNAQKSLEINVTLAGPAKLYVFFDDRFPLPDWLKESFHDTGDRIGKDSGRWGIVNRNSKLARGAGLSIDHEHAIWERTVKEAGTVTLGAPNEEGADKAAGAMYGIAAVPLSDAAGASVPSPKIAAPSN